MRLFVAVCVGVCVATAGRLVGFAQAGEPPLTLTEGQALARFMAADPRVEALHARIQEVRAIQAERSLWPNPVASFSRERVKASHDLFLIGRQELPVPGRLSRLRTAGQLAVEATAADAAFRISAIQAELREVFTMLLASQEREAVLVQGTDDLQELIQILRAREEAGEGSRYDRLRGERALVDLRAELTGAAIARSQGRAELAAYLGPNVAPDGIVAQGTLESSPPLEPVDVLVDRAIAARADHRAGGLTVRQFEEESRAAAALGLPAPSLAYGLKRSGVDDTANNGYQFALDVTVPLFNRGQAAVAAATAQAQRARAETEFLRRRIDASVRAAHARLTMQQARAEGYRQSVADAAEPLVTIARLAYEEGELGILELLDASRQLIDARLRVVELAEAARLAAIDLDRVTGVELQP